MPILSPYAQAGAKLIDNGYSAIPVMPGTKRPGLYQFGSWYGTSEWTRYCDRLPTPHEHPLWDRWPDAGVCVAIDHKLKVIDIDTDDAAIMGAILRTLPDSPVKKRGAKGFSAFYRGSAAIVSSPFSIVPVVGAKSVRVVDLLCHGRQTVLPPTIHPDIKTAYQWVTADTLVTTNVNELPELPDNIADVLAGILEPYGYEPPQEHHAIKHGDGDTLWRMVNDTALLNLDVWVPALGLTNTKRQHNGSYRATADWRGVESANVSFHADGIKDWGNNDSHTAIDVVMLASNADLYTATKWLRGRLGMADDQSDFFDVAGFIARSQGSRALPLAPLVAPQAVAATDVAASENIAPVAAPRASVNPFNLEQQPGVLGGISQWIYNTARAPVAEFATLASIAFLSAFYGRRYVTPTGAGLNLYLVGVAGAGFGKDHPRRAIEMLGYDAQYQWLIGPNEVTSDSAIEKVLRRRPCFVMPWDEIGVMLQGVTGKNSASWTRSIRKAMLDLYGRSTGTWTGKEHADQKTDSSGEPIHCPTVSILGMSTPTEFYEGITEQNLNDGVVSRMTIISVTHRPARQNTTALLKVPTELVAALKADYMLAPKTGNLGTSADRDSKRKPMLHAATWDDDARKRWQDIEQWQLDLIYEQPEYEGIVGRVAEQCVKLATIRALARDAGAPHVTIDDIEWGWAIMTRSLDSIDDGVQRYMAGSEFERNCKDIERAIADAGQAGVAGSVLKRKRGISKIDPRAFESAIKRLIEVGVVAGTVGFSKSGGRPGVRYVLQ